MDAVSLIPVEVETMITTFAGQLMPTVIALLTIVVPIGLALWAVGFAINKGLNFLKRNTNSAL